MAVEFRGFHSGRLGNTQILTDVELVKQGLRNHFNTQKGSRVMDAEYGFIGWDLLFELDRPGTQQALETDARRIVSEEPRVEESSITIQKTDYGYNVVINLKYVFLDTVDQLIIEFDRRTAEKMNY